MALATAYLATTKNLDSFLNAVKTAQAPERMSNRFLVDLGFTSSNDRLFIGLFKALGLITESGEPTERYFQFLDQSESGKVLAQGIREAYEDLFRINVEAHRLEENDVKNKLRTLTRGEKSDNVVGLMAKTFVALCYLADWSKPATTGTEVATTQRASELPEQAQIAAAFHGPTITGRTPLAPAGGGPSLHYNIQIHLPASRDSAVYDAIFKSLKEHLFT